MGSKCIEKIGSIQIFLQDDGTYDGYDFATGKFIANPYHDKPVGYKPVAFIKSKEDIEKEIADVDDFQCVALPDRKLRKESLEHYGIKIGVSEEDGTTPTTHYYPYTKGGVACGYKVRLIADKRMWSIGALKGCDLFGWEQAVAAGGKKLFITEGELDAVSLYQIFKDHNKGGPYADFNPSIVSLAHGSGSAVKDLVKFLPEIRKTFKEIVLVFDMDEPGKKAAEDVVKQIPDVLIATLPSKDANQCLIDGRSKACYNAVQFNAQKPKNTRLVHSSSVADEARKEAEWGFSYPYEALTELTRGQRFGETVYWGSGVKMGKSELLNDLVAHNIIHHGWKCFVVKPEETNKRTLQGIVGKIVHRIFHDPKIPFDFEKFDEGLEKLDDNLIMLNLYQELTWERLQDDIRAAVQEGCKAIYIDPITVLTNGINAADANTLLQKFAQGLAQLAMDLDVIIHIFCHLKAPDNGPSHERGGVVQSQQFAGSRAMMRACNAMIGMQGNKDPDIPIDERNVRELVLLEDRQTGSTGKVKLFYDTKTGAFNAIG